MKTTAPNSAASSTNRCLLALFICASSLAALTSCEEGPTPEVTQADPTPRPPHPFEERTWSGGWDEFNDPYIYASTSVFLSIDIQHGSELQGVIWHTWGELSIDGEVINPGDGWLIYGEVIDERTIKVSRTWYGVILGLEVALDDTYSDGAIGTITVDYPDSDIEQYVQVIGMGENDYVDRSPDE